MKYRDVITMLQKDGWVQVRTKGSHLHYTHPVKRGLVSVPGGGKLNRDIKLGTY